MPFYDYGCRACDIEFEVQHSMTEKPVVVCPACRSKKNRKMVSACGIIIHGDAFIQRQVKDNMVRESEARQDLDENYGVEKVCPVGPNSFNTVYKDIKARGSAVRDEMQQTREENTTKQEAKAKEWKRHAYKRAPGRGKDMKKRKAKKAQAERAIAI